MRSSRLATLAAHLTDVWRTLNQPKRSASSPSEAEVEQLWLAEAARRDAEIDAGAATYPADEVLARARARRG
jgi:hypothetical protein